MAEALAHLGHVQLMLGDWHQAESSLESALALYREYSDRRAGASVLFDLSNVYRALGLWKEAEAALNASNQMSEDVKAGETASSRTDPFA
jgi:tetratricopeptide (TPR) repeat protein